MGKWQHLKAIVVLPAMMIIVVPLIILLLSREIRIGWFLAFPINLIPILVGCTLIILGLILMIKTNRLFAKVGQGTLAPWDPPKKLVVEGPYRHVRNPMILGVLGILLGEAVLFGSILLLVWFAGFFLLNHIYIRKKEEDYLARQFGSDYLIYKENVPLWIPRLHAWDGLPSKN